MSPGRRNTNERESQITKGFLDATGAQATLDVLPGQGHILVLNMEAVMDWIDEALGL